MDMYNGRKILAPDGIPGHLVASECGATYKCPTCHVQGASDEVDIGWVRCPMLEGQYICVGCCIDFNQATRWEPMHADMNYPDFVTAARRAGRSVTELRIVCLRHQLEMIDSEPPSIRPAYADARRYIELLLERLTNA